jgi:tripartite-type tricarboxylate transporter receptor subunit TctC
LIFAAETPAGGSRAPATRRNTDADMKKNLEAQGMVPSGGPPAKFAERIRKDYDRWTKVVKEAGIKPE